MMGLKTVGLGVSAFLIGAVAMVSSAWAANAKPWEPDLVIAQRAAATSVDPHLQNFGPNLMLAAHIFDRLIHQGAQQRLEPGLALTWQPIDALTWEFTLRPDVQFHTGVAFTAEDVVASWRRAVRITGHSTMSVYARAIATMEAVSPLVLRVTTHSPWPMLPNEISQIAIIPAHLEQAETADFESGAAMIGTGPFQFSGWERGDHVRLTRNPDWWGGQVDWERVELRAIPDDAARITALIDGQVDMIDNVPPADVARLETSRLVRVSSIPTSRVIYMGFDVGEAVPPGTSGLNGSDLTENPFRDLRVRQAVAHAINRPLLVDQSLEGQGQPAAQVVLPGLFGAAPGLEALPFDLERARGLLAEAGYPNGFQTTLSCTRHRYVNDVQVCNALALMLTGIGIRTTVETFPGGEFFDRAAEGQFALRLAGWGTGTGEASYTLRGLLGTRDIERGQGVSNFGGYSNPTLDTQVAEAISTLEEGHRESRLAEASRMAAEDLGVVPILFQYAIWATRTHLEYRPINDEFTLARHAHRLAQ